MRIYGSSPLYNYVDLVFRCKRLFIIAVILGTLVTATLVTMRPRQYQADLVVALTSGADPFSTKPGAEDPVAAATVDSRMRRLALYIRDDPGFLRETAIYAGWQDPQSPYFKGSRFDESLRKLRASITQPTELTDQIVKVSLTWPDPGEAKMFLKRLFEQFRFRTVQAETDSSAAQVVSWKDQLDKATAEANGTTEEWVVLRARTAFVNPSRIEINETKKSDLEDSIVSTQTDLAEARTLLATVDRQMQTTPRQVTHSSGTTEVTQDATLTLRDERDRLNRKLADQLTHLTALHPDVVETRRQIAVVDAQIADIRRQPATPKERQTTREVADNPAWLDLSKQKQECEQRIHGLERRIADMERSRAKAGVQIAQMPQAAVKTEELERRKALRDRLRSSIEAKYEAARIEAEQAKSVAEKSLSTVWEPTADLVDTSGKRVLLYGLGPLLGLLIAFCFSLVAETLDHTLRTPVDVEKFLGKPVLAVIPRMAPARPAHRQIAPPSKQSITS